MVLSDLVRHTFFSGVETNPRPLPVVLAAATLPNYGLKSIDERVKKLFPGAVQVRRYRDPAITLLMSASSLLFF